MAAQGYAATEITPPVGFNLFVQGVTGHEISYMARTAVPFFLLMCFMVVLLVLSRSSPLGCPRRCARPG